MTIEALLSAAEVVENNDEEQDIISPIIAIKNNTFNEVEFADVKAASAEVINNVIILLLLLSLLYLGDDD